MPNVCLWFVALGHQLPIFPVQIAGHLGHGSSHLLLLEQRSERHSTELHYSASHSCDDWHVSD